MTGTLTTQSAQYSGTSQHNADSFQFDRFMDRIGTMTPCVVLAVTPSGVGKNIGTVNVQIGVNQIDGVGNATPHGTINNVPYFRFQGGANGLVIDPSVGDIGMIFAAFRDISTFKNTQKIANPGSFRTFDWADSIYVGGCLGPALTAYIQITTNGTINLVSPVAVNITAPVTSVTGSMTVTGNVTWGYGTGDQVDGLGHEHKVIAASGSATLTTTAPIAGT
jgi:hypothetical protein